MSKGNRTFLESLLYDLWYEHIFDMDAIGEQETIQAAIAALPDKDLEREIINFIETF